MFLGFHDYITQPVKLAIVTSWACSSLASFYLTILQEATERVDPRVKKRDDLLIPTR